MSIRKMVIGDYERVYELWVNTPGMGLNNMDDSPEGISKYLERNPNTCFVAEKGGRIIGTILSGHDGRRGFICHTSVALAERKKGVGNALVESAVAALRHEGMNKVALVVFSNNDIGNRFWENRGFSKREDLIYRNKTLNALERIDT